jgi:hypothetical protein
MNSTLASNLAIFYTANTSVIVPVGTLYDRFQMPYLSTMLNLGLFLPSTILGIILSFTSYLIFTRAEFKSLPLYTYYRYATLLSFFQSSLQLTFSLFFCQRFWPSLGSYGWNLYTSAIYSFMINAALLFRTLIDITIILDRIVLFEPKAKFLFKYSPVVNTTAMFFISLIFCIPQIFLYKIREFPVYLINEQRLTHFYAVSPSDFLNSTIGLIVYYVMLFARNVLTVVVEIVLNAISIFLFKRFMHRKRRITCMPLINVIQTTRGASQSMNVTANRTARARSVDPSSDTSLSAVRNLFMMVLALELVSALQQFFLIAFYTLSIFEGFSAYFTFSVNFFYAIKHTINFAIFVTFNVKFRQALFSYFRSNNTF